MLKSFKNIIMLMAFGLLASCGTVTDEDLGEDPSLTRGTETVFLYASNYIDSAQIYTTSETDLTTVQNTGFNVGEDAKLKVFDGNLFILHRSYYEIHDNLEVIDPITGEVKTDVSTGTGTNPQDFTVDGSKAYISLYSQTSETPYDVIVMNWETQTIEKGYSFQSYLEADGYTQARASCIQKIGNKLFVCLQDLGYDINGDGELSYEDVYSQNTAGKLAIVDLSDDSVSVINLKGRNPGNSLVVTASGKLVISYLAPIDWVTYENLYNDPSQVYGGLEIMNVDVDGNLSGDSVFLNDEALGDGLGYVESLAATENTLYVVQSNFSMTTFSYESDILSLPLDATTESESEVFLAGSDARDIYVDSQNRLWVAWRVIGEDGVESSGVEFYNTETGELLGSLVPSGLGGLSITGIAIGDL